MMNILEEKLSNITMRQFLEVWAKEQQDRAELAKLLQDFGTCLNAIELSLLPGRSNDVVHAALKNLRETYNKIPLKWFHR
jgi:hypothetical protein